MREEFAAEVAPQRAVLTGFMGSGKTTVGRLLAVRLGWAFRDLDEEVAARYGASVPEIFAREGEGRFRELEVEALRTLLEVQGVVIALGGGAVETVALRGLLRTSEGTRVVYLEAPFAALYARCERQALDPAATERPLLGTREAAEERFGRRQRLYEEAGEVWVAAAAGPAEDVAGAVLRALGMKVPVR